jgi:hypothetical protein
MADAGWLHPERALIAHYPVGAAEGCDLLIVLLKIKIKRSQPSAAPTGGGGETKNGDPEGSPFFYAA